jgi:hypothetical protein
MEVTCNEKQGTLTIQNRGWFSVKIGNETLKFRKSHISVTNENVLAYMDNISEDLSLQIFALQHLSTCLFFTNTMKTCKSRLKNSVSKDIIEKICLTYTFMADKKYFSEVVDKRLSNIKAKIPTDIVFRHYNFNKRFNSSISTFTHLLTARSFNLRETTITLMESIESVFKQLNEHIKNDGHVNNKNMLDLIKQVKNIKNPKRCYHMFECIYDRLYILARCNPIQYPDIYEEHVSCIKMIKMGYTNKFKTDIFDKNTHEPLCNICLEDYKDGQYVCLLHPNICVYNGVESLTNKKTSQHIVCGFCANQLKECPYCKSELEPKYYKLPEQTS